MKRIFKDNDLIYRVLAVDDKRSLVIDCIKASMPKWSYDTFESFQELSEDDLQAHLGAQFEEIENLSPKAKKTMYERYTLISGVLPFIKDEFMRTKEINADGTYKNQMYEKIIKKSALPKADYYIHTQILDAGTNIKGIIQEDGTVRQDNITPVYIMKNSIDCNFDSQEQFIARRRYAFEGSTIAIIMPDKDKNSEIYTKEQIFKMQMNKLQAALKSFKYFYSAAKLCYLDKDLLVKNMNTIIDTQVLEDGTKLHMKCIYFNEETMSIEYNKLTFRGRPFACIRTYFSIKRCAYLEYFLQ